MKCIIDGLAVEYSQSGKGEDVILVHGWADSGLTFKAVASELSKNFRVTSLDLPNFGQSETSEAITNLEDYAGFLKKFTNKLGIEEYSLVGHSMGGQIAIYAVGEGLLKPDKLVLIASSGIRNLKSKRKKTYKTLSKMFGPVLPRGIKRAFYNQIGSDYSPDLPDTLKKVIANVLAADIQKQAAKIISPTLLIYGSQDTHTPVGDGKLLAKTIKDSRLEIINADHLSHQTKSGEVANLIKKFLS